MSTYFKKSLFFTVLMVFVSAFVMQSVFAVDIYYQNKRVQTDVEPVIENGRTLVPIAVIARAMGADVFWDNKTKQVRIFKDARAVYLTIGSKEIKGESGDEKWTEKLDVPAKIINGRTMIPIRAVASLLESQVSWDAASKSVLIDSDLDQIKLSGKPKVHPPNVKKIMEALKKSPWMGSEDIGLSRTGVFKEEGGWMKDLSGLVRERIPGKYELYRIETEENTFVCLINLDTNQVFEVREGVYSIPKFTVVVPPDFGYEEGVKELIHALMIQTGKIHGLDQVSIDVSVVKEENGYIHKWRAVVDNETLSRRVGSYIVDVYARGVYDEKTGKQIYDDSAVTEYPEKFISKKEAGKEVLALLEKLKILDAKRKYVVVDVKDHLNSEDVEYREGYLVKIEQQAGSDKGKKSTTLYFINNTRTVLMEYDQEQQTFFYLYGRHTPMG